MCSILYLLMFHLSVLYFHMFCFTCSVHWRVHFKGLLHFIFQFLPSEVVALWSACSEDSVLTD